MTFRYSERKLPQVLSSRVEVIAGRMVDGTRVANIRPSMVTSSGIIRFTDAGRVRELIDDLRKAVNFMEGD